MPATRMPLQTFRERYTSLLEWPSPYSGLKGPVLKY